MSKTEDEFQTLTKPELVGSILQMQATLEDLSSRINRVRTDNDKLREDNSVLKQYIDNLMGRVNEGSKGKLTVSTKVALKRSKDNQTVKVNQHMGELRRRPPDHKPTR
eukprot:GFYU01006356.1.p1 GENE.GFYU01006356.1~~GFYU01006356.1.p1  ORF type:complete len:108 (+),score=17.54 GFYU01006356.1:125-448(+)